MAFDYKKECKHLYAPSRKPGIVDVPPMRYAAMRGQGDPNAEAGAYQQALQLLYGVLFTIKMAPKSGRQIDGYAPFVVPPLEGFWDLDGAGAFDPARKAEFRWISCIRLPDFVSEETFAWAKDEAAAKKGLDFSAVEVLSVTEGLCVQCMHVGAYDDEPPTIESLHRFAEGAGYRIDLTKRRLHHEIYLSDPRRCAPERLRTVIRLPIADADEAGVSGRTFERGSGEG